MPQPAWKIWYSTIYNYAMCLQVPYIYIYIYTVYPRASLNRVLPSCLLWEACWQALFFSRNQPEICLFCYVFGIGCLIVICIIYPRASVKDMVLLCCILVGRFLSVLDAGRSDGENLLLAFSLSLALSQPLWLFSLRSAQWDIRILKKGSAPVLIFFSLRLCQLNRCIKLHPLERPFLPSTTWLKPSLFMLSV